MAVTSFGWSMFVCAAVLLSGCNPDLPQTVDSPNTADNMIEVVDARELSGFTVLRPRALAMDPKIELGKALFHDTRLSRDETVSCATCHVIALGGDDNRPLSVGVGGSLGERNAPTVLNAALNSTQFWDGRSPTLAAQAIEPIHNPLEMDATWPMILERLKQAPDMLSRFQAAGFDAITPDTVVAALVAYEEVLLTGDAPFDLWLLGDDDALSDKALMGLELFQNLGCVSCHQGRNLGGNMLQRLGVMADYYKDRGIEKELDLGRFEFTGREEDRYVFRVPSLRNVAETAPYFHDGSVPTLNEAVEIMGRYQLGRALSEDEVEALVAFLHSLTGKIDERLM